MRTTIDLPDTLLERVRTVLAKRKITLRGFVIDSLERALGAEQPPFRLRDASAGFLPEEGQSVSSSSINQAIDEQRESVSPR
jgi:hypothetical protein